MDEFRCAHQWASDGVGLACVMCEELHPDNPRRLLGQRISVEQETGIWRKSHRWRTRPGGAVGCTVCGVSVDGAYASYRSRGVFGCTPVTPAQHIARIYHDPSPWVARQIAAIEQALACDPERPGLLPYWTRAGDQRRGRGR